VAKPILVTALSDAWPRGRSLAGTAISNPAEGMNFCLNAELNPICYLLALLELTIFSTLSG